MINSLETQIIIMSLSSSCEEFTENQIEIAMNWATVAKEIDIEQFDEMIRGDKILALGDDGIYLKKGNVNIKLIIEYLREMNSGETDLTYPEWLDEAGLL